MVTDNNLNAAQQLEWALQDINIVVKHLELALNDNLRIKHIQNAKREAGLAIKHIQYAQQENK